MIIGISGKMGCGKTDFAKHLLAYMGPLSMITNFGDILKREVAERFSFPVELCYSEEGKRTEIPVVPGPDGAAGLLTVRRLLQWWGTEVCRATDPDYWVKAMRRFLFNQDYEHVIIADVRFPNELKMCDIRIRLEAYDGRQAYPGDDHISENILDTYPWDLDPKAIRLYPGFGELKHLAKFVDNWMHYTKKLRH